MLSPVVHSTVPQAQWASDFDESAAAFLFQRRTHPRSPREGPDRGCREPHRGVGIVASPVAVDADFRRCCHRGDRFLDHAAHRGVAHSAPSLSYLHGGLRHSSVPRLRVLVTRDCGDVRPGQGVPGLREQRRHPQGFKHLRGRASPVRLLVAKDLKRQPDGE